MLASNNDTAHAFEEGLEIEQQLNRSFYSWDRFRGYELTETELRLELSKWVDFRWRRDKIENIDTVIHTLDEQMGE